MEYSKLRSSDYYNKLNFPETKYGKEIIDFKNNYIDELNVSSEENLRKSI